MLKDKKLSVVIPVYNEEACIHELISRLYKVMPSLECSYEIIMVDDGSIDGTPALLHRYAEQDPLLKVIIFSRNFGNQAAVSAGLQYCTGDFAVIMDADLQDPPELIPQMVEKWSVGYEIVYAQRTARKGESILKKASAAAFYRVLQNLTPVDIPPDTGDFRLIDRKVITILNSMPEKGRFLRGMVSWTGYRQTGIRYAREKRFAGKTKYPLFKMLKFALTGLTSFSFVPLQLASYFGMLVSVGSFIAGIYVLYLKFFTDKTIQGWTSLMIVVLFLGGIQLITLGIIGEYVGRISDEVKNRPPFLIRKKFNL